MWKRERGVYSFNCSRLSWEEKFRFSADLFIYHGKSRVLTCIKLPNQIPDVAKNPEVLAHAHVRGTVHWKESDFNLSRGFPFES